MDEQTRAGGDGRCPSGIDLDALDMQDVKRQVKDQAGTLVREAKEEGSKIWGEVGDKAQGFFEQGKDQVAQQVRAVADSLKNGCGDQGANGMASGIGRYAQQAGDKLNELADTIRDASPRDLGRKAEGFARNRPEVFLGGALVTGVLIGRFLRSHQPRETGINSANLGHEMPDRDRRSFSDSAAQGYGESVRVGESGFSAGSEIGATGPGIGAAATGIGLDSFSDEAGEDRGGRGGLEGGV